ncbi:MAG: hypothetical protein ACLFTQ_01685 [Candidatus Aenigmatarchaeota archaeon]
MSARILGGIDILGGFLLVLSRVQYPRFGIIFLGLILIGRGIFSLL